MSVQLTIRNLAAKEATSKQLKNRYRTARSLAESYLRGWALLRTSAQEHDEDVKILVNIIQTTKGTLYVRT